MKTITFVILIFAGLATLSCSQPEAQQQENLAVDLKSIDEEFPDIINKTETIILNKGLEVKLKREKFFIDSLASDTNSLIVLAKLPGKEELALIKNDQWPEEVETSYNIFKDKNAQLRYFVEMPFSGSGDWFIAYKSYFNIEGQLIAFQKETNFFNSECTDGSAHEVSIKYYDLHDKLIDSAYTLTDSNKQPLERSSCFFPYDFPFEVYRTVEALRKALNIID